MNRPSIGGSVPIIRLYGTAITADQHPPCGKRKGMTDDIERFLKG